MDWSDIGTGILYALAYIGIGVGLLVLAYVMHDVVTPGKLGRLGRLLTVEGNVNAAVLTASHFAASGFIIATAIWTTHGTLFRAIVTTTLYGLGGIIALALAQKVVDILTPGKLSDVLLQQRFHPMTGVVATVHIAMGLIVAVSIV